MTKGKEDRPMAIEEVIVEAQRLFADGKNEEAAARFADAIALDPEEPNLRTARGAALMAAKRFEEALAELDRAAALSPGSARALYRRGMARMALKDFEGAVADFSAAIVADPQYGVAFYSRGEAYDALGKAAEAQEDLRRAWVLGQSKLQGERDTYGIVRTEMDRPPEG
jgi:tetratricopeptide (TPR) repeat protein